LVVSGGVLQRRCRLGAFVAVGSRFVVVIALVGSRFSGVSGHAIFIATISSAMSASTPAAPAATRLLVAVLIQAGIHALGACDVSLVVVHLIAGDRLAALGCGADGVGGLAHRWRADTGRTRGLISVVAVAHLVGQLAGDLAGHLGDAERAGARRGRAVVEHVGLVGLLVAKIALLLRRAALLIRIALARASATPATPAPPAPARAAFAALIAFG
jgi:hypothetical protein